MNIYFSCNCYYRFFNFEARGNIEEICHECAVFLLFRRLIFLPSPSILHDQNHDLTIYVIVSVIFRVSKKSLCTNINDHL